jgi:alpha-galactosidase
MNASAMATSGLIDHGWSFVNVDGGWEGYKRGGEFNGILPDSTRFPDLQELINYVHGLGLKFGLYHQAYKNTYDGRIGASSDDSTGKFYKYVNVDEGRKMGKYLFHWNDAQQFAKWGIDYLKYDWWIRNLPHAIEMGDALKNVNRDIIYSVCNGAAFCNGDFLVYPEAKDHAIGLSYCANLWRSGNDTKDSWQSVVENGFTQNRWQDLTGPGHWNDPDMLILGWTGWGTPKPTLLTPDEQYSHFSLWCLLSAPLIIGCDLSKLDDFTLGLLTNDEVIDVDQDPLGKQGTQIQLSTYCIALVKQLEDGSKAVGIFNLGSTKEKVEFKFADLGLQDKEQLRDLWRQKDVGMFDGGYATEINAHGVVLFKMSSK